MSSLVQNAASLARPGQRWLWLAGALFAMLVVFVGFAPTFYLRNLFAIAMTTSPPSRFRSSRACPADDQPSF